MGIVGIISVFFLGLVVFFIGIIVSIIDLLSVFDSSQKINFLSLGQLSNKDLRSTSFSILGTSNLLDCSYFLVIINCFCRFKGLCRDI